MGVGKELCCWHMAKGLFPHFEHYAIISIGTERPEQTVRPRSDATQCSIRSGHSSNSFLDTSVMKWTC